MTYTLNYESRNGIVFITVTGDNSIETVSHYLSEVYEICQHHGCINVLIVENLSGPSLDTLAIYNLVSKRSNNAAHVIDKLAFVDINPEHDQKAMEFAEDVAVNRGLSMQVFSSVAAAEDWLLGKEGQE